MKSLARSLKPVFGTIAAFLVGMLSPVLYALALIAVWQQDTIARIDANQAALAGLYYLIFLLVILAVGSIYYIFDLPLPRIQDRVGKAMFAGMLVIIGFIVFMTLIKTVPTSGSAF